MDEPLLVAANVSRQFTFGGTAVAALREATCAVYPGDRIALTGPSGSGKSTLLHLLGGLDRPTGGHVTWPGLGSLKDLRPGRVVDVFQGPSLLPPLTVFENVRLPLLLGAECETVSLALTRKALEQFGLLHLADKLPEELSGGQAQRVAIARALVVKPELVLADEPTGQLDSVTALAVIETMLHVLDGFNAALVVSTHDQRVIERLTVRWAMRDGYLDAGGVPAAQIVAVNRVPDPKREVSHV